jgi:hypothetical protein
MKGAEMTSKTTKSSKAVKAAPAKAAAPTATNGGSDDSEVETGLTCKSFSLVIQQKWKDSASGTAITTFELQVNDENGNRYVLSPPTISDVGSVVQSVLDKIATAQAGIGWKFDGVFYPHIGSGIITG